MIVEELKKSILYNTISGKYYNYESNDTNIEEYASIVRSDERIKRKDLTSNFNYKDEIPRNCKLVKLGDIVGIYGGKRIPAGRKLTRENTGHYYIRVSDMGENTIDSTEDMQFVPKDIVETIKSYIINKDDIYITVAGTIGKIGYIPDELDGANLTENADKLVFSNINKKWLIYALKSEFVQKQIQESTTKVGQPKLAIKRISNIEIILPSPEEQVRTTKKLDDLFSKIDEVKPIEDKLNILKTQFPSEMKKSFYKYAFSGNLKLESKNDQSVDELMKSIYQVKEAKISIGELLPEKPLKPISNEDIPYQIPENWKWVRLGDYCEKVTDQVASGSFAAIRDNVPSLKSPDYAIMVKTADFSNDFTSNLTYTTEHAYNFLSNSNLFGGELIMSNIGSIGKVFIVPKLNHKMTLAPNCVMLRLTNDELRDYLYHYLLSPIGYNELMKITSGTAMKKFNKTDLKKILIPVPPIEEQKRIVSKIEQFLPLLNDIDTLIG